VYSDLGNRGKFVSKPSDLAQGTLDLLVLKIIMPEPTNGWRIGQPLEQVSSKWRLSANNLRAKFYSLTRLVRRRFGRYTSISPAVTLGDE
jgi:PadR family transcriptional regulator PadR